MKVTRKQIRPILEATFPDYCGRTFRLEFVDKLTVHDTNWGGGTRVYYKAYCPDGSAKSLLNYAPWDNPVEGQCVPMVRELLIVTHHFSCGKDMGITIYAHPSYQPKYLEA